MLTPLMFWTVSHHLLEREGGKDGTKNTKKQRGRRSYMHNYIQTEEKTNRDGEFDVS